MDFCRAAVMSFSASSAGRASPWKAPEEYATLWDEVLAVEFDGPQQAAVATLARLAHEHRLALLDQPAHRVLTTADITTTFGVPMVPAAAGTSFFELVMNTGQGWSRR